MTKKTALTFSGKKSVSSTPTPSVPEKPKASEEKPSHATASEEGKGDKWKNLADYFNTFDEFELTTATTSSSPSKPVKRSKSKSSRSSSRSSSSSAESSKPKSVFSVLSRTSTPSTPSTSRDTKKDSHKKPRTNLSASTHVTPQPTKSLSAVGDVSTAKRKFSEISSAEKNAQKGKEKDEKSHSKKRRKNSDDQKGASLSPSSAVPSLRRENLEKDPEKTPVKFSSENTITESKSVLQTESFVSDPLQSSEEPNLSLPLSDVSFSEPTLAAVDTASPQKEPATDVTTPETSEHSPSKNQTEAPTQCVELTKPEILEGPVTVPEKTLQPVPGSPPKLLVSRETKDNEFGSDAITREIVPEKVRTLEPSEVVVSVLSEPKTVIPEKASTSEIPPEVPLPPLNQLLADCKDDCDTSGWASFGEDENEEVEIQMSSTSQNSKVTNEQKSSDKNVEHLKTVPPPNKTTQPSPSNTSVSSPVKKSLTKTLEISANDSIDVSTSLIIEDESDSEESAEKTAEVDEIQEELQEKGDEDGMDVDVEPIFASVKTFSNKRKIAEISSGNSKRDEIEVGDPKKRKIGELTQKENLNKCLVIDDDDLDSVQMNSPVKKSQKTKPQQMSDSPLRIPQNLLRKRRPPPSQSQVYEVRMSGIGVAKREGKKGRRATRMCNMLYKKKRGAKNERTRSGQNREENEQQEELISRKPDPNNNSSKQKSTSPTSSSSSSTTPDQPTLFDIDAELALALSLPDVTAISNPRNVAKQKQQKRLRYTLDDVDDLGDYGLEFRNSRTPPPASPMFWPSFSSPNRDSLPHSPQFHYAKRNTSTKKPPTGSSLMSPPTKPKSYGIFMTPIRSRSSPAIFASATSSSSSSESSPSSLSLILGSPTSPSPSSSRPCAHCPPLDIPFIPVETILHIFSFIGNSVDLCAVACVSER